MTERIDVKRGDTTRPTLTVSADLTGATLRVLCRSLTGGTTTVLAHTVTDATAGTLTIDTTALAAAEHDVEVEITRPGGVVATAPTIGTLRLKVHPDLG